MTEKYFVHCECGSRIRVELFDAGTTKHCPACRAAVPVPGSTKLKELAGDKYPYLRPIEKLQRALHDGEAPFDGYCHVCDAAHAAYQIPIQLNAMVERHVYDNSVRPTMTGGLALRVDAAEETWRLTVFPLLLCTECHTHFESAQSDARMSRVLNRIMVSAVVCFTLYLIGRYIDETLAVALGTPIVFIYSWKLRRQPAKQLDAFVLDWISRIRWMPETLASEDEYVLSLGTSRPLSPTLASDS